MVLPVFLYARYSCNNRTAQESPRVFDILERGKYEHIVRSDSWNLYHPANEASLNESASESMHQEDITILFLPAYVRDIFLTPGETLAFISLVYTRPIQCQFLYTYRE